MVTQTGVVLTGPTGDSRAVLAVPYEQAVSDASALLHLAAARTLGEVRTHPVARALVGDWLESYREQAREGGDENARGADDEVFSAETFFGEGNWRVWHPDARDATVAFLVDDASSLADDLLVEATEIRLGADDSPPFVPTEARAGLDTGLAELGYIVLPWPDLSAFYDGVTTQPPPA